MNAMTEITARIQDPYWKPYRYYTLAERVDNARMENKMIAATPKHKRFNPSLFDVTAKSQAVNHEYRTCKAHQKRDLIVKALSEGPRTIRQIEALTGINSHTVRKALQLMEQTGRVMRDGTCAVGRNGTGPQLWRRPQQGPQDWLTAKTQGYENRTAIFAALATPRAPFQVADAIAVNRQTVAHIMRQMSERGLIREAGETRTFQGKRVATWVQA